jgi:hypothetical protein
MKSASLTKILFGIAIASALTANLAKANLIYGDIAFTGGTVTYPGTQKMSNATGFKAIVGATVQGTSTGSYSAVTAGTAVTFKPFSFTAASVTPLWTFNFGGLTYSFDATSVTLVSQSKEFITLDGNGWADITKIGGASDGYTATAGTWSFVVTAQGKSSATWAAATDIPQVPDTGATALLIGLGLSGVGLMAVAQRRKLVKA